MSAGVSAGKSGVLAIIPARLGSTRLPGKVLLSRTGKPLIQHVWEAARRASIIERVVIATDDQRVRAAAESFGAECVMTSPDHPNGTSRLAEACDALGLAAAPGHQCIVNIQGDEPDLHPALVDAAVAALLAHEPRAVAMSTAAVPLAHDEAGNPNIVKVVRRVDGTALYFSRALIPFDRDAARETSPLRHVGLYAYRRWFLAAYRELAPTPLEQSEKIEQLRVLEHGHSIAVAVVDAAHAGGPGIDTPEQYEAFVARQVASPRE